MTPHTKRPAKMKPSAQPSPSPGTSSCSQLAASCLESQCQIWSMPLVFSEMTEHPALRLEAGPPPSSPEPICGEDGEEGKWSFVFLFVLCVPSLLLSVCHSLCRRLWIFCESLSWEAVSGAVVSVSVDMNYPPCLSVHFTPCRNVNVPIFHQWK